jgi:nicotinamidase-related amidase
MENDYLIVLDIQQTKAVDEQKDSLHQALVNTVNKVIGQYDPDKVIYVKNAIKSLALSSKGFVVDTLPIRQLDKQLQVVSENIFTKYEGDAFTSDELGRFLEQNEVKKIVIVGRLAEECIYKSVIGGKKRGYQIHVIPEAIMGSSNKKKEKALLKMQRKGIGLFPLKEVI